MYESRRGEYVSDDEAGTDVDVLFTTAQDRCRSALNRSFDWPPVWNDHFSSAPQRWVAAIGSKSNTFSFANNERAATPASTHNFLNRPHASAAKVDRRRARRVWQIIARQFQTQPRIEYNQQWRDALAAEGRESAAFIESLMYKWRVAGKLDFQREGRLEFFSLATADKTAAG